jgi:hypothetical protein
VINDTDRTWSRAVPLALSECSARVRNPFSGSFNPRLVDIETGSRVQARPEN